MAYLYKCIYINICYIIQGVIMCNYFGWWADCASLDRDTTCPDKEKCKEDWIKSGGRVGGMFDKER